MEFMTRNILSLNDSNLILTFRFNQSFQSFIYYVQHFHYKSNLNFNLANLLQQLLIKGFIARIPPLYFIYLALKCQKNVNKEILTTGRVLLNIGSNAINLT